MENSIAMCSAVVACVWCGIAFLRSSGEKKFQPKREMSVFVDVSPSRSERRWFDSTSPHHYCLRCSVKNANPSFERGSPEAGCPSILR